VGTLQARRRTSLGRSLALFLLCSTGVPLAVAVTVVATALFAPLPAVLPDSRPTTVSRASRVFVLGAGGARQEIAQFREFEQNVPVTKADIPLVLKQAVVAAEDRGFYRHGGVDFGASLRAFLADVRSNKVVQGGSTITQQYVKNTYVGADRTLLRKLREAVVANQLDRQVDKDEILFRYLSSVYLGEGAYGVGAASETYFRKPVSQVTLSEAALLAGLIPAPSLYEPRGNPVLAEEKRRIVLEAMLHEGSISQMQFDQAVAERVANARPDAPAAPVTVVYPPQQESPRFPFFVDYVRRYLIARFGPAKVFRGGLDVTVTLDPALQAEAEAAVQDQLAGTKPPLEMSLVAVEPPTGYVKALVGGRDFTVSQVNLALGGCPRRPTDPRISVEVEATCWRGDTVGGGGTGRQPGSAFKPFVLAAALAQGYSPAKVYRAPGVFHIPNCRPTPANKCTIGNNEGGGGGSADLRRATVSSINTVYAQLVRDVGCDEAGRMAQKLGLTSAWYSPQFHTCSGTYALGVIDVSPLDMASAFGVFATRGRRAEPTPVLRVTERGEGGQERVLEDNTEPRTTPVIDDIVADGVTQILQGVITSGTGTRARIDRPAAGKTGTGQNFTNAWFVGYTPTLSTAVWMGHAADQRTPLLGVRGVPRVFGGTIPADTWRTFMSAALRDVPVTQFSDVAPVRSLGDALRRAARGGFDPGDRRPLVDPGPGGPYVVEPPAPKPEPATPAPTAPPPPQPGATTSTTRLTIPPLLPRP
jgi:penicillin-binding protein 1A